MLNENGERFKILYILLLNRFKIIKQVILLSLLAAIIAVLFFPNWYKSTARIILPEIKPFGIGNLITSMPFTDFIAPNLVGGTNVDNIIGIIESRSIKDNIIKNFKLDSVYKFRGKYFYEDLLDELSSHI